MNSKELGLLSDAIVQFYEKIFSWEHGIARNTGLSPQQLHTIEIVGSNGPIRMKPLAEKLSITTGTLTVMVNRLEKGEYLYRKKDPQDGRGFNILLTGKGKAVYKRHHDYHQKLTEEITGLLEPSETKHLLSILTKINKLV